MESMEMTEVLDFICVWGLMNKTFDVKECVSAMSPEQRNTIRGYLRNRDDEAVSSIIAAFLSSSGHERVEEALIELLEGLASAYKASCIQFGTFSIPYGLN